MSSSDSEEVPRVSEFCEDGQRVQRQSRNISISSVDSDPLPGVTAGSEIGSDDAQNDIGNTDQGVRELRRRGRPAIEDSDLQVLVSESVNTGAVAPPGAPVLEQFNQDPARIEISNVSSTPIAQLDAVLKPSRTVVAHRLSSHAIVDIGTRVVLRDGTVVGRIHTLFGPREQCCYAIVVPEALWDLVEGAISCGPLLVADDEDNPQSSLLLFADVTAEVILDEASVEKRRGTDASFTEDQELPPNVRPAFSDDEAELAWKAERKRMRGLRAPLAPTGHLTTAAGAGDADSDEVSSSGSEAIFDDEGRIVQYKAKGCESSFSPPAKQRRLERNPRLMPCIAVAPLLPCAGIPCAGILPLPPPLPPHLRRS